jgi:gluconolactonase
MCVGTALLRRLTRLLDVDAHEGPTYVAAEHALYFTTVPGPGPRTSICRLDLETLDVSVVREDANAANGMTLGRDGRLLVCEQGTQDEPARISAVDRSTGVAETVVDSYEGRPLNSPNDIVVAADGSIWFTDPSYGYLQGFRPAPAVADGVYRFDGTGLELVADTFDKPNGLAFSPDGGVLYVGDSGANHEPGSFDPSRPHRIVAFDVVDGSLAGERIFAEIEPGFPDGLEVDSAGRLYSSSFEGIQVFSPEGRLLEQLLVPGAVNFTFGESTLYVTTDTAIWAAELDARGA